MNDGILLVNFEQLRGASANIQGALNELESRLSAIEKAGGELRETWTGEAKSSYDIRHARWRESAGNLSEILRNIQGAVEASTSDFQATERRAAQRFQ